MSDRLSRDSYHDAELFPSRSHIQREVVVAPLSMTIDQYFESMLHCDSTILSFGLGGEIGLAHGRDISLELTAI